MRYDRWTGGDYDAEAVERLRAAGYPALLSAVLAARGAAAPEETLLIGDSNVDIQTAKNAGVASAGVSWGFRGRQELAEAGADFIADDAGQLEAYILS